MNREMTNEQVEIYLESKGYSQRICKGGRELLIERWETFVANISETGRTNNWLIDDYWIFLEMRDLIHDIGCDDRVKQTDDRFRAMLTAKEIRHRHGERHDDYDFWNYGYPSNSSGFFYEQIKFHILNQGKMNK
jgi:hypothetical protein